MRSSGDVRNARALTQALGKEQKNSGMSFPSDLREKLLLWCDRRCCLCRRTCEILIELHHIVPKSEGGTDDEDNAIPLCFDCHAKVGHYNDLAPRGTKFKPEELKKRREQVYEEYTRHLVPGLGYKVIQAGRQLPDVGFVVQHLGDAPPVRLRVMLDAYIDGQLKNAERVDPLYRGGLLWNLNPKEGVHGHFPLPDAACIESRDLRVEINITISDVYERAHKLLPVTYVYSREGGEWWLDPLSAQQSLSPGRQFA